MLELANAAARTNVLANNPGVDVQAGRVVFDYSGAGDDPKTAVLNHLKAGYALGFASGPMFCSTAIGTKVGLGWVDSGVGTGGTGTVTVQPAVYGDADLNGAVGSSDLSIVLSDFGKPGISATGDFDYNGTVGSSDLSIVLADFGQTLQASFNVMITRDLDAAAIGMMNDAGIGQCRAGNPGVAGRRPVGSVGLCLAEARVSRFTFPRLG